MSIVRFKPLPQQCQRGNPKFGSGLKKSFPFHLNYSTSKLFFNGRRGSFCSSNQIRVHRIEAAATSVDTAVVEESSEVVVVDNDDDVVFSKRFPLNWTQKVEGKMCVRLDKGEDENMWKLIVGCNLPGKWILHWGVTYTDDIGSEWDQPPLEMRPPGSISIKDYAIETSLKKSSSSLEGQALHEVQIDFNSNSSIAAINFVFKDEETGTWCQYRGRNFKVPLTDYLLEDANVIGAKDSFTIWPGALDQMSTVLFKIFGSDPEDHDIIEEHKEPKQHRRHLEAFYKELSILKEVHVEKSVTVCVRKSPGKDKKVLHLETDLPGDVVVHWGVCRDNDRRWEIPEAPHPPETKVFKEKALRTSLQLTEDGHRSWGLLSLDDEYMGMLFVLKLNDNTWLNHMGNDFYVPLSIGSTPQLQIKSQEKQDVLISSDIKGSEPSLADSNEKTADEIQIDSHTNEIVKEIRNLVTDISIEKSWIKKSKEAKENILQEIEKLAAEAYSMFRSSSPEPLEVDVLEPPIKLCSGTGSGYEVVLQGFNWESHKSGKWYMELKEKATELSSLGFTIVWLPPPTDSVSPEGYMPRDLYDLNSRYGSMEELKDLVKSFHKAGLKVLGDAVLNHRCAQHQNHNGVWNIFGGKLNWDDRAVVADDEHFQGRGNKSSGESFHAAPNIDHSQDFVRKDLTEWLCWMRKEIGYDGWRLDFVRGFWGGYVKDYMAASEPYFAVGEYWDSLSYTYGEMDHNQDAHRQRIVDWINATSGSCGAFDVTTKGILHAALERCEYWRLSDQKGKPPGVVGWWPSRAVTFIENHDTGSTQGHWRFPGGKEMQGYAYILTHPGTPAVFYDHVFSDYHSELAALVTLRQRTKINCRSTMKITKADRDVYAAIVDEKVAMKIGPGHYEPPHGSQNWNLALEGRDYKVWEASQT